jgi:ELWxxDGT repeat protein
MEDILPGSFGSSPYLPVNVDGTLYFATYNGPLGRELWRSDGTAAGTVRVKSILR